MKAVARRQASGAEGSFGYAHEIEIDGGHTVLVDEPASAGGTDTGPSPTRLVAAALAGCVAVTIEMYAERKGWDVGAVEVEVEVDYEDYAPRSFTATLRLPEQLDDEQRERLLAIAARCPVHKVLAGETAVSVSDRVEPL
jgi:putative redox protein